jgi:RNA polymerase sigma-70 factor (ECF subfamily)
MALSGSKENELIRRIQDGDSDAFEIVYMHYFPLLCEFVYRFVHDRQRTKDIVQNIFIRIWQNRKQWNPTISLASYLFRSAQNAALDEIRHSRVERENANRILDLHGEVRTPLDQVVEEEMRREAYQAIDELPEKCRTIFLMSRFGEMTYQEIAETLEISPRTVHAQISRALKHLRKRLAIFLQTIL